MASGDEGHITVNNGRKLIEILADIPTYFKVNLKEKRPVGKFTFTYITPNQPVHVFWSWTCKKPDEKVNIHNKFIGEIGSNPPIYELGSKVSGRDSVFLYD
jgi:hypothetical protein